MKKKILFFLVYDEYERNFVKTGIIKDLKKKFNVSLIFYENDVSKKKLKNSLFNFKYSRDQIYKFNLLNWSASINNEDKSTSFKFQNVGIFLKVHFIYPNEKKLSTIINFIPRILIKILKLFNYFKYKYLTSNNTLLKRYKRKFPPNSKIKDAIKKINPDLIVFPTKGNHPALLDVMRSKKVKSKVFLLCDNWDNPSSKFYLPPKVEFISVWGKQGKKHAIKCNNFVSKNIEILGTPKYSNFIKNKNIKLKSHFNFRYFLFLESWVHDGLQDALSELNDIISKNKDFNGYKIIFRTHPHRRDPRRFNIKNLKNVIMDPNIKANYENNIRDNRALTDLNYYPPLLQNSDLIVCGPTTMLIESAMYYKKTILLATKGKEYFNHKNCYEKMLHLKEVSKFPLLRVTKSLTDLDRDIKNLMKVKINKNIKLKNDNILEYFLTSKTLSYSKNLKISLQKILS